MHTETSQGASPGRIRRRTSTAAPSSSPDAGSEDGEEKDDGRTTNTRTVFGSVTVKDPGLVIKLGLVIDNHKLPNAWLMWPELEKNSILQLSHLDFDPRDLFYSEKKAYEGYTMTTIFRFYTPISNRMPRDPNAPL